MSRWQDSALCKGKSELFFSNNTGHQRQAKQLCSECPVQRQCLDESESLATAVQLFGVWAGQTRSDRDRYLGTNHTQWTFDDRVLRYERARWEKVNSPPAAP